MDNNLIISHINEKNKQEYTNKKYGTYYDGKTLQICFYSTGCRFSKTGGCIMCDYGQVRKENLNPNDIKEIMREIFTNQTNMPKVLLLNSLGSVLDETEMPHENLIVLLDEISKLNINVIIFETHYTSIKKDILELIKDKLPNKTLEIELGFESSNPNYRKNFLNKIIDNDKFIETLKLIKSFNFIVECNVIFGMPFLSINEQIQDTISSINWCFQNGIDEVDLFPINIKPYTLLYKLYEEGKYKPVHHTDFINVLKQIPETYIDKIHICWYGNRELYYKEKKTILPLCDNFNFEDLMAFYNDFNMNKDKEYRIKLLKNIVI